MIEEIRKVLKKSRLASDIPKIEVLPSGIYELDRKVLTIGGFPRGRLVELFGPESGGKSSICLRLVSNIQKMGCTCVYFDAEGSFDKTWAESIGVDLNKLILPEFTFGEEALDQVKSVIGKADLVVIDSVPSLIPKSMFERDSDKEKRPGAQANMYSVYLNDIVSGSKFNPRLDTTKTCVIGINQLRMKISMNKYENPEETPGGKALKHLASVRLRIKRVGMSEDRTRIKIKIFLQKSKVSSPFTEAEIWLNTRTGQFDEFSPDELVNIAFVKGLIDRSGAWITIKSTGEKIHGAEAFSKYCRDNKDFYKAIADVDNHNTQLEQFQIKKE